MTVQDDLNTIDGCLIESGYMHWDRPLQALARLGSRLEQTDKLAEAATALYGQVQMDESVGVCLSSRGNTLILGETLREWDGDAA